MGAGKSTVGRLLADVMRLRFEDLDETIERHAGESVAAIFERAGERVFRRLEASALAVVAMAPDVVVATGGGIMTSAENRALMAQSGVTVWLNPEFDTIARRLESEPPERRPLFGDRRAAAALFEKRRATYQGADLQEDVGADEEAGAVAARVAARLRRRRCAT